ncbi:SHOCT domain-containing protein [Halorubellus litoreus]|uniref:SHOCT domain-containing protein n=1 Tax=Halorubellus litoreus TaxID=755308 RepID=A0ABD5VMP0_9EURY
MFTDRRNRQRTETTGVGVHAVSSLVAAGVTALTLTVAFGLLALDVSVFWVAFPIGFGVVLPAAIGIARARHAEDRRATDARQTSDAHAGLQILRERYATGELSEAEFEQRVERLLESESEDHPRDHARNETRR